MAPTPAQTEAYSPKELELIAKLKALEEDRIKFIEIVRGKVKKLEIELEVCSTQSILILRNIREIFYLEINLIFNR